MVTRTRCRAARYTACRRCSAASPLGALPENRVRNASSLQRGVSCKVGPTASTPQPACCIRLEPLRPPERVALAVEMTVQKNPSGSTPSFPIVSSQACGLSVRRPPFTSINPKKKPLWEHRGFEEGRSGMGDIGSPYPCSSISAVCELTQIKCRPGQPRSIHGPGRLAARARETGEHEPSTPP